MISNGKNHELSNRLCRLETLAPRIQKMGGAEFKKWNKRC